MRSLRHLPRWAWGAWRRIGARWPWETRWMARLALLVFAATVAYGLLRFAWPALLVAALAFALASLLVVRGGLIGTVAVTVLAGVAALLLHVANVGHLAEWGPPLGLVLAVADHRRDALRLPQRSAPQGPQGPQ